MNIQAYNTAGDYGAPLNNLENFQNPDASDLEGGVGEVRNDVGMANDTGAGNLVTGDNSIGLDATDDKAGEAGSTCEDGAKFDPNTGAPCDGAVSSGGAGCADGAKFDPNTGAACPVTAPALAQGVATSTAPPTGGAIDTTSTDGVPSTGGTIEGFSVLRDNSDLLLRSLVFGCVFFILAHNETRMFVVNNVNKCCSLKLKAKDDASLLILMGLFVVSYFVLSRYIL